MVKYLSFCNSSFALRYFFLMQMAMPQCDTPLVQVNLNFRNDDLSSRVGTIVEKPQNPFKIFFKYQKISNV
jgi:hypothetical protein